MTDLSAIPDWLLPTDLASENTSLEEEKLEKLPNDYTIDDLFQEVLNNFDTQQEKKYKNTDPESTKGGNKRSFSLSLEVDLRTSVCEKCMEIPDSGLLHTCYCPYCAGIIRVCSKHIRAITPHGFKCNKFSRVTFKRGVNRLRLKKPHIQKSAQIS